MNGVLIAELTRNDSVSSLVICGFKLFFIGNNLGTLLRTDDNLNGCFFDIFSIDNGLLLSCGEKSSLVKKVCKVCTGKACGGFCERRKL